MHTVTPAYELDVRDQLAREELSPEMRLIHASLACIEARAHTSACPKNYAEAARCYQLAADLLKGIKHEAA